MSRARRPEAEVEGAPQFILVDREALVDILAELLVEAYERSTDASEAR